MLTFAHQAGSPGANNPIYVISVQFTVDTITTGHYRDAGVSTGCGRKGTPELDQRLTGGAIWVNMGEC